MLSLCLRALLYQGCLGFTAMMLGLGACGPIEPQETIPQTQKQQALQEDMVALFVQAKAFDAASPVAQKLYQQHKDRPGPAYWLGVILREKGVYSESEKYFLEALTKDPKHAPSFDGLGILYGVQGKLPQAIKAHKQAIEIENTNAKYWNNYGFALSLNQDFSSAIKAYEQSIRLAPHEKRSFVNLAFVYGAQNKHKEAEHYLSQVLPKEAVFLNLALIYEKQGQLQKAQNLYQKALQKNPHFSKAQVALKRLKALVRLDVNKSSDADQEMPKE